MYENLTEGAAAFTKYSECHLASGLIYVQWIVLYQLNRCNSKEQQESKKPENQCSKSWFAMLARGFPSLSAQFCRQEVLLLPPSCQS